MKKPQVMRPGRVHTSQAAPSTTRTPGNRIEHNDEVEQAIGGPRLGGEPDFLQCVFWGRGEDKRRLASRP